jgi:hypothetical protein
MMKIEKGTLTQALSHCVGEGLNEAGLARRSSSRKEKV